MSQAPKKPGRARAIADVSSGTLLATVEIAAPPERVFRALTSDEIVRWWGSDEMYRTTKWEGDLRVHGRWRSEGRGADGTPFHVEGEYLEIDPPRKLVQTWKPEWEGGHETRLTFVLEPIDAGTRVVLRHEGFGTRADACRSHSSGWERVFNWLSAFVTPPAAEAGKYFLCRLLPPRASFPFDMTPDERAVMQEHVVYWTKHMQAGKVVVFGPVGDPKGPWGVSIVRAGDNDEINAIQQADPAIRAAIGFKYELLPMLNAVLPDAGV